MKLRTLFYIKLSTFALVLVHIFIVSVVYFLIAVFGIFLFLLAVIGLLSLVRCRLFLTYADKPAVTLKIGWLKQPLLPWDGVKLPFARKSKKSDKKKKVSASKSKTKTASSVEKKPETIPTDPREIINMVSDIATPFLSGLMGYLRTDIRTLRLEFHGKDAAQTAIMYSGVMQSVAYLIQLFASRGKVKFESYDSVQVIPIFNSTEEKIRGKAEIQVIFTLRIWQLTLLGVRALLKYLKYRNKGKSTKSKSTAVAQERTAES